MNFDYTDEQKAIRKEVVDFCGSDPDLGAIGEKFDGRELEPLVAIAAVEAFGYASEDEAVALAAPSQLLGDGDQNLGRVGQAAVAVGKMQRDIEAMVKTARAAKRSGDDNANQERVSIRIADLKVRLESSRLLVYRAVGSLGSGNADAAIAMLAVTDDEADSGALRDAIANELGL